MMGMIVWFFVFVLIQADKTVYWIGKFRARMTAIRGVGLRLYVHRSDVPADCFVAADSALILSAWFVR